MTMRPLIALLLAVCLVPVAVHAADPPDRAEPAGLLAPDGSPFAWWDWLEENGPAAVLVWSSWAPHSGEVLDDFDALRKACGDKGLSLIVVDVQEPLVEARTALGGRELLWVHDRHGALLKRHRVFRVPMLLILDSEGKPLANLEPKPVAVRGWSRPR